MSTTPPPAETIPIEWRIGALEFVVACVQQSYPGSTISLVNIARLVDNVAEAFVKDDRQAIVVHGTRLLSMGEISQLCEFLEDGGGIAT